MRRNSGSAVGIPRYLGRCFLAFCLTGGVVFYLARNKGESDVDRTATATVRIISLDDQSTPTDKAGWPEAHSIEEHVRSDGFLAQGIERLRRSSGVIAASLPADPSAALGLVRSRFVATAGTARESGVPEVSITYRDPNGEAAVAVANCLAELCAEHYRTHAATAGSESRTETRAAAERARQDHRQLRQGFGRFLDAHFDELVAKAEQPRPAGNPAIAIPAAPSIAAKREDRQPEEDRQWSELDRQLKQQRDRLAALRLERTPAHPEVQEMEGRVRELEQRLAPIPRPMEKEPTARIVAVNPPDVGPIANLPNTNRGDPSSKSATLAETYRTRKADLDRAAEMVDRLTALEWEAWAQQPSMPLVEIQLADVARFEPRGGAAPQFLALVLAAALTAALGVVMVSIGLDIDPPLATLDEAKAKLPVPMVGTLRVPRRKPPVQSSQVVQRVVWMAIGAAVLAACVGLVSQAI